ncbi:carbohydrate ABC transporter permease [Marvinbryantia sp.]|uniref:carbohydrate ABC transporter permease n=1 Tax=Marvinbryantia sp. TaxID=2496532 RepID=UPI0025D19B64|nr:carbohydrate ABC transporter permease [uncultured Marvinbryantia sp.]
MRENRISMLRRAGKMCLYLVAIALLIVQVYPVFWIFCTSFKSRIDIANTSPFSLPQAINFENYMEAWTTSNLPTYYLNSILVVSITLAGLVVLSACAGFAIEKMRFRFNNIIMTYFLAGITVPIHATLIPLFQIYKKAGILNTHIALILPMIGFNLSMSIYLFTAFYRFVPDSLIEAAVIDGSSILHCFARIILPMSKNTILTVITMNLIFTWNEFTFTNTFINDNKLKTIPVGLYDYVGSRGQVNWGATFAAISLFMLPLLLVYFFLNKSFLTGLTAGATKE